MIDYSSFMYNVLDPLTESTVSKLPTWTFYMAQYAIQRLFTSTKKIDLGQCWSKGAVPLCYMPFTCFTWAVGEPLYSFSIDLA